MANPTKEAPKRLDPTVAIVAYICGAVGLILVLGITFCILRRIRWRRARKYIKQQSKRSVAMGPVLTSKPPSAPWKWKEVKANIKARRKGEEKPYPGHQQPPQHTIATISNGQHSSIDTQTIHGVTRPQSANGRPQSANGRPQSANGRPLSAASSGTASATTLGQPHRKMHGDKFKKVVGHTIKQERLQKRLVAKSARRERKQRVKAIKHDLVDMLEGSLDGTFVPPPNIQRNGQRLPGDEFPRASPSSSGIGASSPITHVGPLRRESLLEIPSTTYLITQSPRDRTVHRSTGAKQLDLPQPSVSRRPSSNLCTWEEERGSTANRSMRGGRGASPRHMQAEVVVHDRRQDSDIESITSDDHNTTEL